MANNELEKAVEITKKYEVGSYNRYCTYFIGVKRISPGWPI